MPLFDGILLPYLVNVLYIYTPCPTIFFAIFEANFGIVVGIVANDVKDI
jgi:hypothetical protein